MFKSAVFCVVFSWWSSFCR